MVNSKELIGTTISDDIHVDEVLQKLMSLYQDSTVFVCMYLFTDLFDASVSS